MAAAELHSLWLESPPKPARMGGVYGYIICAFAKAPQISSPSAATTRSSLYETRSLSCWTSHRSRFRHLSRQPAAPAASGPRIPCRYPATLSYENSSIKEQISVALLQMSHCFWAFTPLTNTASVFHAWHRTRWNSAHWDGMSPLRDMSLFSLAHG